jgi:hypothetical protein
MEGISKAKAAGVYKTCSGIRLSGAWRGGSAFWVYAINQHLAAAAGVRRREPFKRRPKPQPATTMPIEETGLWEFASAIPPSASSTVGRTTLKCKGVRVPRKLRACAPALYGVTGPLRIPNGIVGTVQAALPTVDEIPSGCAGTEHGQTGPLRSGC